jgi:N-acyl-D-aspartate/D-glutamate deacylase
MKADINVVDYGSLRLGPPRVTFDLPGGGRRLIQDVSGIKATLVSGVVTHRDGLATGALPGRLVRSA